MQTITVHEFARRLSALGTQDFTAEEVTDLATAVNLRINPDEGIDAGQAQRLLDRAVPSASVTGAQAVAPDWPPAAASASGPAIPPVVFSSPGAVDAPEDAPARPRGRSSAPPRRTGGPRRSGR